jgi:hypothetical protein
VFKKSLAIGIVALWLLSGTLMDNAFAQIRCCWLLLLRYAKKKSDRHWRYSLDVDIASAQVLLMTLKPAHFLRDLSRSRNVPHLAVVSLSHDGTNQRHLDAVGLQLGGEPLASEGFGKDSKASSASTGSFLNNVAADEADRSATHF